MTEDNEVAELRAELAALKTAQQPRKRGVGKGVAWALTIVLLLVIVFVLITIYDHVSGNFDDRNSAYGAPAVTARL